MSNTTNIIIRATDLATKPLKGIGGALKRMTSTVRGLRFQMLALGSILGGLGLGKEFIDANSQLETMKIRLGSLLNSAEAGNEAFGWVKQFQEDNPVRSIQEFSQSFTDLVAAGIDPTTGALKNLTAGAVKFGLSKNDVAGVTRALKQMLAVSNVQKQEINQLSERIPGVQRKLADAFKMTSEQFKKAVTLQKISSTEAVDALLKIMGKDADKVLKSFTNTWDANMARMSTSWFNLMTAIGDSGAFDEAKGALAGLTRFVNENTDVMVEGFGIVWKYIKGVFKDLIGENSKFTGTTGDTVAALGEMMGFVIGSLASYAKVALEGVKLVAVGILKMYQKVGEAIALKNRAMAMISEKQAKERLATAKKALDLATRPYSNQTSALSNDGAQIKKTKEQKAAIDNLRVSVAKYQAMIATPSMASSFDIGGTIDELTRFDESMRKLTVNFKTRMRELGTKIDTDQGTLFDDKGGGTDAYRLAVANIIGSNEEIKESSEATKKIVVTNWLTAIESIQSKWTKSFGTMDLIGARLAETMNRSLTRGFDDMFDQLLNGHIPNLKSAITSFLGDIAKMMLNMQSQRMASALTSSLLNGFGGAFSGFATTAPTNGISAGSGGMAGSLDSISGMGGAGIMMGKATPSVEIINNSGTEMEATMARVKGDNGSMIMQVVMDSVSRNKGGSRDGLKALLG